MARNQYQSNISMGPIIDISDIWRYSMEKEVYEELKRIQNKRRAGTARRVCFSIVLYTAMGNAARLRAVYRVLLL